MRPVVLGRDHDKAGIVHQPHHLPHLLRVLDLDDRFVDVHRDKRHVPGHHDKEDAAREGKSGLLPVQSVGCNKAHRQQLGDDEPRDLLPDVGIEGHRRDHPDDTEAEELLGFPVHVLPVLQLLQGDCRKLAGREGKAALAYPVLHFPDKTDRVEPCRHELDRPDQGKDEDRELVEEEERDVEVHRAAEPLLVVHGRPVVDGPVPAGRVHLEMHALQGDAEVLADQRIGMEEERRVERRS